MQKATVRPTYQDFGLTKDAVARLPRPLIAGQWGRIVLWTYGVLLVTVITGGIRLSGSPGAAFVFGVLMVTAASVLLIPAAIAVVCVVRLCEEWWLCRKVVGYRAWTQYRRALSEHERSSRALQSQTVGRLHRWLVMDRSELRREVTRLIARSGHSIRQVEDGEAAGFDLMATAGTRRIAVRCCAGSRPCGVAEARELITAQQDAGATCALLMAPAGGSEQLDEYLRSRSVSMVDGRRLAAAEEQVDVDLLAVVVAPAAGP